MNSLKYYGFSAYLPQKQVEFSESILWHNFCEIIKYIIKKMNIMNDIIKKTVLFAGGMAVGAAIALLLAPKSGEELRNDLKSCAEGAEEKAKKLAEELKDKMEETAQTEEAE